MKFVNILKEDLKENNSENIPISDTGLSSKVAKSRLQAEGLNQLTGRKNVHALKIFAGQFKDFLTVILLASTVISVLMQEYIEAISIAVIILLNAVMGFVQEYRTEKTLEALKNLAAPTAKVYRDGAVVVLPTSELVRGDVILVEAGDRIPADCAVIQNKNLQADESLLTGESVPVDKLEGPKDDINNDINKSNIIYMGGTITKGRGKAKVIATGMKTQMGNIAGMLEEIEEEETPLQKRLGEIGKYIAIICLVICFVIALLGWFRGEALVNMFITAISLAVAAVPEGLPAVVTISLALAVSRMVKRNALIMKLHAVETLGCADVICSDKTGTLTENKMTVKKIMTLSSEINVSGNGYEKAGGFFVGKRQIKIDEFSTARMLLDVAVLCNNAEIMGDENDFNMRDRNHNNAKGKWKIRGEPTEVALLIMAAKVGVHTDSAKTQYEKIEEIPFDSTRKCMSVIVKMPNGKRYIFTKGAYDVIMRNCTDISTDEGVKSLTPALKKNVDAQNENMAKNALRVLGFAFRELGTKEKGDYERNQIFLGLTGMIDPPRKEAKESVRICRLAGIRTIMITGDHQITACAIAKDIGIFKKGNICLSGTDIDNMSDQELNKVIEKTSVFARVNPAHKLKIVRILKRRGHIVAMTGDGINDAPAIKEADIGCAMGDGTDVTKEAADVVLLDNNFATLVATIEEGRTVYANIRKFIRYLLSCNIGEVMSMFLGMMMGMPVILQPVQILLINLLTDGLPAIALGLDPGDDAIMKDKPRKSNESVFARGLFSKIIFRGVFIGLTTVMVFITIFRLSGDLVIARTGALMSLVLSQLIHVFECKSESKPLTNIYLFNNIKLVFAVIISAFIILLAIYTPIGNTIFATAPLGANYLLVVFGISIITPIINLFIQFISKPKLEDYSN